MSGPVIEGYDALYASIVRSPTFRDIWRRVAVGVDYPDEFSHISFLTLAELRRLSGALGLPRQATLVDLACGGGGPGLWAAREAHARLIGVDLSSVGLTAAEARARSVGLEERSRFLRASFVHTGLPAQSVDGVMSVDSLQYSPDKRATFVEVARILRPFGRFAFTAFELAADRLEGLEVLWPDPVGDYGALLAAAGFSVHTYEETDGWRERLRSTYEALTVAASALSEEMGEMAANALLAEATLTLERDPFPRRVFCMAERK